MCCHMSHTGNVRDIILCYISCTDNIFVAGHKHKLFINKEEISTGEACDGECHNDNGSEWNLYERYLRIRASTWSSYTEVITADKVYSVSGDLSKPRIIIDHRIT